MSLRRGMFESLGVVSSGGNPVLLQTAFVKFTDEPNRVTIPNYTNVYNNASGIAIPDNTGAATGITITVGGNQWTYEFEVDEPQNDPDFVAAAMRLMVYLNPNETKTISINTPTTANRRYKLTWMVYQSSGGNENITKVTIGGVAQTVGGANRALGKSLPFNIDNPGNLITAVIAGDPDGNYPCINALKIEIYQI